jgi:multiple antibiotic resistance protein
MTFYSALILLILVMNPLGNIPVFLSTLKPINPKNHTKIIIRETLIACVFLIIFMIFGQYLLHAMQISEQALGASGGIILFLIAIRMIFPPEPTPENERHIPREPFIVPLAIPLTAGPASMATVMLFASQYPDKKSILVLVISLASLIVGAILLSARYLSNILGEKGLIALERLSGMILTAMAVQMLLAGLNGYFKLH